MIIKNMKNRMRICMLVMINYVVTSQKVSEKNNFYTGFVNKILFLRIIGNY